MTRFIIDFMVIFLLLSYADGVTQNQTRDAYYSGCLSNTTKCESNGSCAWPPDTCSKQADQYMKELKEK